MSNNGNDSNNSNDSNGSDDSNGSSNGSAQARREWGRGRSSHIRNWWHRHPACATRLQKSLWKGCGESHFLQKGVSPQVRFLAFFGYSRPRALRDR